MIKFTFELYPEDDLIKPYFQPYGYIFRAVIMKWLNEIKPELVHQLHEYEKIRPYSINCIIHKKPPKIDFIIVSFKTDLSITFLKDLISSENVKLKIGQKNYYLSHVKFKKIDIQTLVEESGCVKKFNISFPTSVYFNTKKGDYPVRFPIPILLFGNLVHIWNYINDTDFTLERNNFLDWINAHVYASGYKMKTAKREIGKPRPIIGGLGNVSYTVASINKIYYKHYLDNLNKKYDFEFVRTDYLSNCKWLEILCKLGQYTNVGGNRTAGMGVMRYYPKKYVSEKDLLKYF